MNMWPLALPIAFLLLIAGKWLLAVLCIIVAFMISMLTRRPSHCDVCSNPIDRTWYRGTLDGQPANFCPYCYTETKRERSRREWKRRRSTQS